MIDRDELVFDLESPVDSVRKNALIQISRTYDTWFCEYLEQVAKNDVNPELRYYAKRILHAFSNNEDFSVEEEKPAAQAVDNSQTFVFNAEDLKKQISEYASKKNLKIADSELLRSLNDKSSAVRQSAVGKAAKKREFLPELVKRLEREDDVYVKAAVIKAIGEFAEKEFYPHVMLGLKSRHENIRCASLFAVKKMSSKEELKKTAVLMLEDSSPQVRSDAITSLKGFADVDIFAPLRKMVYSEDIQMRKHALYAIMDISDKRVIPFLESLSQDPENSIAIQAKDILRLCFADSVKKEEKAKPAEKKSSSVIVSAAPAKRELTPMEKLQEKIEEFLENRTAVIAGACIIVFLFIGIIHMVFKSEPVTEAVAEETVKSAAELKKTAYEAFDSGNYIEATSCIEKLMEFYPRENQNGFYDSLLMHIKTAEELMLTRSSGYEKEVERVAQYFRGLQDVVNTFETLAGEDKKDEAKTWLKEHKDYFQINHYNNLLSRVVSEEERENLQTDKNVSKTSISELNSAAENYISKLVEFRGEFIEARIWNNVFVLRSGADEIEVNYSKLSESQKQAILAEKNYSRKNITVTGTLVDDWGLSVIAEKIRF